MNPEEAATPRIPGAATPNQPQVDDAHRMQSVATEQQDREAIEAIREENRRRRMEYLKYLDPELPGKVEIWKQNYPRVESAVILGQMHIWRGMSRAEYIALMSGGLDKLKNEEAMASKCLLYPEIGKLDWVNMPAGIPSVLSEMVLATSGFGIEDPITVRL